MQLLNTHPVKKSDLGFHGNLFGGQLMSWIDSAAASYAMEFCHNRRMVTVRIDECIFKRPAREGSLLKIYGRMEKIGVSSCTIYMEARSFNVYTHAEEVVLETHIVFVRVDEDGNPIPISDKVKQQFNETKTNLSI
jgi:acyl-CoA thioesterase YciA